jgi:hypothetical protein
VAAPEDLRTLEFQYQKDQVRYQELLRERESTEKDRQLALSLNQQTLKSVQAEMRLVEQQIESIQKKVQTGSVSPADPSLLQLQRDLLALQRKADEIGAAIVRK